MGRKDVFWRFVGLLFVIFLYPPYVLAAGDIPNAEDHPLVSRYPDSRIIQHLHSEFEDAAISIDKSYYDERNNIVHPKKHIQGEMTTIEYQAASTVPVAKIVKNYVAEMQRRGIAISFSCFSSADCGPEFGMDNLLSGGTPRFSELGLLNVRGYGVSGPKYAYVVGSFKKGDSDIYIAVLATQDGDRPTVPPYIVIDIVESKAMQDDLVKIDPDFLKSALETSGKVVLQGIYFDTDKSSIKSESKKALQTIAEYLSKNAVSVFIVGHTDNVGSYDHNFTLSNQRASAVVTALANEYHIDRKRLSAVGVGPVSPAESNASDKGRAANRRVEMVLR